MKTNNCLLVTLRGNRPGGDVVTLISKVVSDREFNFCKKPFGYMKHKINFKVDKPYEGNCNLLCLDEDWVEAKFHNVAQHLSRLTQVQHGDQSLQAAEQSRIETIFAIYSKLLSLGPLEFHLVPKSGSDTRFDLLELRLQVLHFIENLDGYCNSIGMLRFILKSQTMIGVMFVHKSIMEMVLKTRRYRGVIQSERGEGVGCLMNQ